MARIRSIKPEFPQSESMGNVSRDARLTFLQLWTIADDEGRLRGNSRMLASLLFPYDDDAPGLIDGWLLELEREGCIARYKVGGQSYVQICNWLIHQKIDKPSKSKIPPFDESSRILANPREVSSEDQGSKDQGVDQGKETHVEQTPLDLAASQSDPETVKTIFEYWQKVMKSPKSVLDAERRTAIKRALKEFSPTDICKAIRGCSKSAFNMGENDRRRKYNGLGLILRNAEKIEKFMELDGQDAVGQETIEQRNARIIAEVMGDIDPATIDPTIIEMEPA